MNDSESNLKNDQTTITTGNSNETRTKAVEKPLKRTSQKNTYFYKELKDNLKSELIDESRAEIEKDRLKQTEILSIFFALFTFISVNVQVFSHLDSVSEAILFMLLMLVCLVVFMYFAKMIIWDKRVVISFRNVFIYIIVFVSLIAITLASSGSSLHGAKIDRMEKDIETLRNR